jgi:hypothetical protein
LKSSRYFNRISANPQTSTDLDGDFPTRFISHAVEVKFAGGFPFNLKFKFPIQMQRGLPQQKIISSAGAAL